MVTYGKLYLKWNSRLADYSIPIEERDKVYQTPGVGCLQRPALLYSIKSYVMVNYFFISSIGYMETL